MTITLKKDIRVSGVVVPAGTTATYADDFEADQVARGNAAYAPGSPGFPGNSVPVLATPSESGRVYEVAGIDVTDELTGGAGGGSSTLPSGTYSCDVGTRTWTGTIKPAILTLTPGAGGTAYVEATEDGTTWVVWSEGVVSAATTARLAGPVVGLRVVSAVSASSLGVVA